MASRVHTSRIGRHPVLLYIASGLVGGVAADVGVALVFPSHLRPFFAFNAYLSVTPLFVLAAAAVGGVLAGWFMAALAVSRAPGQVRCPRCGTANDPRTRSCDACALSFG